MEEIQRALEEAEKATVAKKKKGTRGKKQKAPSVKDVSDDEACSSNKDVVLELLIMKFLIILK